VEYQRFILHYGDLTDSSNLTRIVQQVQPTQGFTRQPPLKTSGIPPLKKMKPSEALAAHREEIREIVLAHRAANARVFGSVVHGSDTDESDLDILVDPTADTTLFDLGAIRYKLRNLLGIEVDVLTPEALPEKFRQIVISEARSV
jgi:predicted nucleotidyltransferase